MAYSTTIVKMKGHVMKRLAKNIGCCALILFVFFFAELCLADLGFLASLGKSIPAAGGEDQPAVSDIKHAKQSELNTSSNRIGESNGFSEAVDSGSRTDMLDRPVRTRKELENADSPFQHYLLVMLLIGAAGLTMVTAGAAQWWRRRYLRQNWLFPAVPDDGEPFTPAVSSPGQLIAKKQLEELPPQKTEDTETEKHAQRRAA